MVGLDGRFNRARRRVRSDRERERLNQAIVVSVTGCAKTGGGEGSLGKLQCRVVGDATA